MRSLAAILCGVIGLSLVGCMEHHHGMKHEEEDEVKMAFADVPAPVQATLTKESGGATIAKVDKEMWKGKTIYEADVMMGGKNWEFKVAEDGTLVEKKLDMSKEDEEKEEHGKK